MASIKQIRLSGLGGHGVVFAGTILGKAAIGEGKWVSGANTYGSQARGGLTRADVVISDHPISFPHILKIDILLAFTESAYVSNLELMNPHSGVILYDHSQFQPGTCTICKQIGIEIMSRVLHELDNKQVANMAFLGAMNALLDIVEMGSLVKTIQSDGPSRFQEINQKALQLGVKLGESLR